MRFGLFLRFSFDLSFFASLQGQFYSAELWQIRLIFHFFKKLVKDLKFIWESKVKALWKLPITRQVVANFLFLLIKLIVSTPFIICIKKTTSSNYALNLKYDNFKREKVARKNERPSSSCVFSLLFQVISFT